MNRSLVIMMLCVAGLMSFGTGCRAQRTLHSPESAVDAPLANRYPQARLASYSEPPTGTAKKDETQKSEPPPKVTDHEKKKAETVPAEAKPAAPVAAAYTAPGAAYQQLSIAAVSSIVGVVPTTSNAGKEASESLVFSPQGTSGRLGVITTATSTDGGIVARTGTGQGALTGIGFASPNNIFNAQVNRLSGPTGRCNELAGAGFFGGSRPQCEVSFKRTR